MRRRGERLQGESGGRRCRAAASSVLEPAVAAVLVAWRHGSGIAVGRRGTNEVVSQQPGGSAAREEIARLTRQQAALAELGQAALTRADVGLLVGQTCAVVEWALGASHVSIVQAEDDGTLALRFGVGSNGTFSACNDAAVEHKPLLLCTFT